MSPSPTPDPAPLDDLRHIRQLMDRNTRFLSLSGLSGIAVGIVGLAGAAYLYWLAPTDQAAVVPVTALVTLALALLVGWYFTWRLVRRRGGHQVFTPASRRMLQALGLPLLVGAVFCAYVYDNTWLGLGYWPSIMLSTYGLGLAAAAHYTLRALYWLGLLQLALGFAALLWMDYGLLFWALGFGGLHIVYGIWMYLNYDRKP